ncbi:MAG: VOC family protein [Maritimibacter sp.]
MIRALHHIQLAMPEGGEAEAIRFYRDVLGLEPVAKPPTLQGRGGTWFEGAGLQLHLGVEMPFHPARKAHPAFQVTSLAEAKAQVEAAGLNWRGDVDLPGISRIFVDDPFGNRIELVEVLG